MRKLIKNRKEEATLENINSSCACIEYCGGSFSKERYQSIQRDTAHNGDPSPFRVEKDI